MLCNSAENPGRAEGDDQASRDEIYALGIADLDALATHLGICPFAVADQPTSIDACVYSFLANVIRPPIEMPLKSHAPTRQALCVYVERMEAALAMPMQHRPEPRRAE
jgi:glutathione S-transferase